MDIRGKVIVGILCLAAMGPPTARAQDKAPVSRVATYYASTYGVSIEEAKRRLAVQRAAGDLNARLEKEQSAIFGGMYVEHIPSFRIVAKFTRNGVRTLAQYTRETAIVVEPALQTYSNLVAAQSLSYRLIKDQGFDSASYVDIKKGIVKFFVNDPEEVRSSINRLTSSGKVALKLPSYVIIEKANSLSARREANIEGGRQLSGPVGDCTSGFTVYNKTTGRSGPRYLTTAGHCENSLSYNGASLSFVGENYAVNSNNDFQWHSTPGFNKLEAEIYTGLFYNPEIISVKSYSSMIIGEQVCKYGVATLLTCGSIVSKSYNLLGSPGFVLVHNQDNINLSDPGDSGAPWFLDEFGEAWGSHSDSSRENVNDAVFMPIENVGSSNLEVLTVVLH